MLNRISRKSDKGVFTLFSFFHSIFFPLQIVVENVPVGMAKEIAELLQSACSADGEIIQRVNALLDNLDDLLRREGFDPATSLSRM
jgi:hypothetical protein